MSAWLLLGLQGSAEAAGWPSTESASVTLITGDRVTMPELGLDVDISRGPGREAIGFIIDRLSMAPDESPHLFVIPEDAIPLLAAGQVDRRLFDVTLLARCGYDDAQRPDLPLIVRSGAEAQAVTALELAAASTPVRRLPAIDAMAIAPPKARASELWRSVVARGSAAGAATALPASSGVEALWLDGCLEPLLDVSVPRIGAPAAWALGYEGDGVVVAVLDTGVDVTHPDLADAVIVSRNFTADPPEDESGHGTHVASIIAGSGVASGGRYRGVAPAAQLLAAKVCGEDDCPESSIIAGLHWAIAEEGARVVNMSLGDRDTPGFDPVEQAVSTLAAQYGALIVAGAGNSGPLPRTITRPGNLAVALTVGAIEADDRIASFSSRGFSVGDEALKPDITAPSRIMSARAAGTEQLTDDVYYAELGGTSSAAPLVAGAAALLFQQHPSWTAADVKAALMGSALFNPADAVLDQGAGRVDIAAALDTSLLASASSLSFGTQRWPRDDDALVTRTLSVRNLGPATELWFELDVTGPDGAAAPDGVFAVTPSHARLPEGGTASVRLTADVRLGQLDGVYGGRLLVSDGAARGLSVPVAVERERKSHDLVLRHLDRRGAATANWRAVLITPGGETIAIDHRADSDSGDVTLRLPAGEGYALDTFVYDSDASAPLTRILVPNLTLQADALLVLDAQLAAPVRVAPPSDAVQFLGLTEIVVLPTQAGSYVSRLNYRAAGEVAFYQADLGPPAPGLDAWLTAQWIGSEQLAAEGLASEELAAGVEPPAFYAGAWLERGHLPAGPVAIDLSQTALVRSVYAAAPTLAPITARLSVALDLGARIPYAVPSTPIELPHRRSEYFFANDPSLRWAKTLLSSGGAAGQLASLEQIDVAYLAGSSYAERWNFPVFSPALPEPREFSDWAYREGAHLVIEPPLHSDGTGHFGAAPLEAITSLYRDGERVAEIEAPGGDFEVPPETATYRVEIASRQSMFELSPEQTIAWTFESAHVEDDAAVRLPLLVVRFAPELSDAGEAPRGAFALPLSVDRYGQESPPAVGAPSLEVSYDDGLSWSTPPLEPDAAGWNARLDHPGAASYVSLRASAEDDRGNRVEQTVLRAYRLATP